MNRIVFLLVVFALFFSSASALWPFESQQPPFVVVVPNDVNGEDLNVGLVVAETIDANAIFANYYVARNFIDANFLMDANIFGNFKVFLDTFLNNLFVSGTSWLTDLNLSGKFFSHDLNQQFVPYVGAISDVDLGSQNIKTTGLDNNFGNAGFSESIYTNRLFGVGDTTFDLASDEGVLIKKPASMTALAPLEIRGGYKLTIPVQVLFSTNDTDNSTQSGGSLLRHYDRDEEPVSLMVAQSSATDTILLYGGSGNQANTPTIISFSIAESNTTLTDRTIFDMRFATDGNPTVNVISPSGFIGKLGFDTAALARITTMYLEPAKSILWIDLNDFNPSSLKIGSGLGDGSGTLFSRFELDGNFSTPQLVVDKNANVGGNLDVDGNYGAYGELWQSYVQTALELPVANVYNLVGNDWNAGDFYNTTPNPDANTITVNQNGMYLINVSLSFTGDQSVGYEFGIFINGVMGGSVTDRDMHIIRTTSTNAEGAVSISGLKSLVEGDVVDLRVEQVTGANKEITFSNINFVVTRVG